MDLISVKNASYAYEGKYVLTDINFSIQPKDYLCIVGENGSGKSTLIKGILQLKKQANGEIIYNNIKSKEIGYLPQQSQIQKDFIASVYEVVLSGCLNSLGYKPFYGKKEKAIAIDNLKKLDIYDIKDKCYAELSGGQQQRVLLARALCATKKIIILDEPVSGLDPLVTKDLYDIINKINKEFDITVIMVSHDVTSIMEHCNKILHLDNNQLFFGSSEEYKNSKLGMNYIGGHSHD